MSLDSFWITAAIIGLALAANTSLFLIFLRVAIGTTTREVRQTNAEMVALREEMAGIAALLKTLVQVASTTLQAVGKMGDLVMTFVDPLKTVEGAMSGVKKATGEAVKPGNQLIGGFMSMLTGSMPGAMQGPVAGVSQRPITCSACTKAGLDGIGHTMRSPKCPVKTGAVTT